MLKLPNNNAWRYTRGPREPDHVHVARPEGFQFFLKGSRKQHALGEPICVLLFLRGERMRLFKEDSPFAMQYQMARLMEEREPEVIVREVAEAQQQQGSLRRQKVRRAACATTARSADNGDCDTVLSATTYQLWKKHMRMLLTG